MNWHGIIWKLSWIKKKNPDGAFLCGGYGADKLHWYIPEELRDFHLQVVSEPEVVREERTALLAAMTAAN